MSAPRLLAVALLALAGAAGAAPSCRFEPFAAGPQKLGRWIDRGNWLDPAQRRAGLLAGPQFMPGRRLPASGDGATAAAAEIDRASVKDPVDERPRSLDFLLDSRLAADGLVVIRNGRTVVERYRNGLEPATPRLLLDATRPLLNLLGAIAITQGKLSPDKAVARGIPGLSATPALRKLSVQRLIETPALYTWPAADLDAWRRAAGWTASGGAGVHQWLRAVAKLDFPEARQASPLLPEAGPEDALLGWLLSQAYGHSLAQVFCEQWPSRQRPQDALIWLADPDGDDLADGLALSLGDFARLGQAMLEARVSRSRIPGWFIDTLTAAGSTRAGEIPGLARGSETRYGFIRLGGRPNRIAIIGEQGASLYIDFDRHLVVALYTSGPAGRAPLTLATLEALWASLADN